MKALKNVTDKGLMEILDGAVVPCVILWSLAGDWRTKMMRERIGWLVANEDVPERVIPYNHVALFLEVSTDDNPGAYQFHRGWCEGARLVLDAPAIEIVVRRKAVAVLRGDVDVPQIRNAIQWALKL